MELIGVRVEMPANVPIVLLREMGGQHRTLPIFIGHPEAAAIAYGIEKAPTPRPMTHDLMCTMLEEFGCVLERVVVTELREATFFAELHLLRGQERRVISSRPSDAIALATRTGTPIFADEVLLEEAGYPPEADQDGEDAEVSDDMVEQFREFIEHVNPDDFAS